MTSQAESTAPHQDQPKLIADHPFQFPQVIPNIDVNSVRHKMFEAAEEIENQLNTARHIVAMTTDCGYNAALVDENHPGDARLDGDAIYNTLQLALDNIKKVERKFEEYRYMHLQLPISEKTLVKAINELDQDQLKRLINSMKQSLEREPSPPAAG